MQRRSAIPGVSSTSSGLSTTERSPCLLTATELRKILAQNDQLGAASAALTIELAAEHIGGSGTSAGQDAVTRRSGQRVLGISRSAWSALAMLAGIFAGAETRRLPSDDDRVIGVVVADGYVGGVLRRGLGPVEGLAGQVPAEVAAADLLR